MMKKSIIIRCIVLLSCLIVFAVSCCAHDFEEKRSLRYEGDQLHFYEHKTSGMEVIWVENQDVNKSFMLGVRTPTVDSTGVNHIIEHTLFTGSKKYPSSSLFFDANEAYPSTYMNALTSGDMTMFPFSTPHMASYNILLDIYLDSIFNPDFLKQPYGFYEESFFYVPEENRMGGVVYNEMKGASQSTERSLFRGIRKVIYKDTPYVYDSGGSPNEIPTLTYEHFLNTYKRFYYPGNMEIILYGDLPIEETLNQIESYVSGKKQEEPVSLAAEPVQKLEQKTYPVSSMKAAKYYVKSFILPKTRTPEEMAALEIWMNLYLMSPGSPFEKQLTAMGLGESKWLKDDDLPQPVYSLVLSNVEGKNETLVERLVEESLEDFKNAYSRQDLFESSILNKYQFMQEEEEENPTKGISISKSMLDNWAHGRPIDGYYRSMTYLNSLKKLPQEAADWLLEESQTYSFFLEGQAEPIKDALSLSPISKKQWQQIAKGMEVWQQQKVQLPSLDVASLVTEPKVKLKEKNDKGHTLMVSRIGGKLVRSQLYYPTAHLSETQLPYLFLYSRLLEESAQQLQPFRGRLTTKCVCYGVNEYAPYLRISILTDKNEKDHGAFLEAARENLLRQSDGWYREELKQFIRAFDEQSEENMLGTLSMLNLGGETGAKRYLYEMGVPLYNQCKAWQQDESMNWVKHIKTLDSLLYNSQEVIMSIASPSSYYQPYIASYQKVFKKQLKFDTPKKQYQFTSLEKNSLLKRDTNVDYLVKQSTANKALDGTDYVLAAYVTRHYLNPNIRVRLGAYGTSCEVGYPYTVTLFTYRDPDYRASLKMIESMPEFLAKLPENVDLEKSKVEALSRLQEEFKLLGGSLDYTSKLETLKMLGIHQEKLIELQKQIVETDIKALKEKNKTLNFLLKNGTTAISTQKITFMDRNYTSYQF